MDEKPPRTLFYPTRSALTKHNFFRRSEIKKIVTTYFSPGIDEDNKKNRNKIGAKMKTLEAKPFDQNAENWKRENRLFYIDRARGRRLGAKSNRYARTQKSSNSFISFSLLKLFFLVRNWHYSSRKAFPRQMTPKAEKKTVKTAVFRHRWQAWKIVRSITAVRQRPRTPRNWRCSFAFFESFLWHFNNKQRAEVIFRLSRPVSCKNQENGSGKQWSLHAPLN